MQGAESPHRDEAIVIGVNNSNQVTAELWDGSAWTAHASNPLSTVTDSFWFGFDVAYESLSGDAIMVYNNGTTGTAGLSYRVWNGSAWTGPFTITTPLAGEPKQLQLAAHPYTDEMVLVVSNATSQDYAWCGTGRAGATPRCSPRTEPATIAPTSTWPTSSRAVTLWWCSAREPTPMCTSGCGRDLHGATSSRNLRRWEPLGIHDGSHWGPIPTVTGSPWASWRTERMCGWPLGPERVSRMQTVATTATTGINHPAVAVAFEATSGQALATYGEGVNTPRYRTWTSGSGWSGELSAPDIGGSSNSMMLYTEPDTDGVMFAVQDAGNDLHYLYWNGSSWGSDNELETNTAEIKNQPFLFLWPGSVGVAPPAYTVSGTVFEDVVGDVLNDGTIGDAANPGAPNVDVYIYEDDGDGNLDGGDTLVGGAPIATDVNGDYSATVMDGDYFVVVDSKTVASSQDPGAAAGDVWAEQTYGPVGGFCDTGVSYAKRATAGPCYGGIASSISDDFSQWDDHEHRAIVQVAGGDVTNLDFGFSFNVVVNTNGGDTRDDDTGANRTVQGSLRQFIQNANAISGSNAMRFVPADPAGLTDGGGNYWWRIPITTLLPAITDDGTTVDGTRLRLHRRIHRAGHECGPDRCRSRGRYRRYLHDSRARPRTRDLEQPGDGSSPHRTRLRSEQQRPPARVDLGIRRLGEQPGHQRQVRNQLRGRPGLHRLGGRVQRDRHRPGVVRRSRSRNPERSEEPDHAGDRQRHRS